ncbi:MAG: hypothetical protein EOO58_00450 [Hymenobacter sp.]|nr:MAG: hypothetical protein EOO58_00450 [Hymenobacter sp.]
MLKRLHLRNFTVFADAEFEFGDGLNVLVGTNGTGKTHVLKAGYAVGDATIKIAKAQVNHEEEIYEVLAKHAGLINSLIGVFRTEGLWKLRRNNTVTGPVVEAYYDKPVGSLVFDLSSSSTKSSAVDIIEALPAQSALAPLFIPAKEVISFYQGFSALYRKYNLAFDQTYLDLCEALGGPYLRDSNQIIQPFITVLEHIIKGRVVLDGDRFYLYSANGTRQEMSLAAEGIRKFAILMQLLANGTLTPETTLFWDEPEANLNPALLKELAVVLTDLAQAGFQIILATHSLFLMRELHILAQQKKKSVRYFGLYASEEGDVRVERQDDLMQLQHITALDAELTQTFDFEAALNQDYAGDS